ncbi:uncharacterized protein LOC128549538 [Mercenaria mercenaria]|uniref:uncharacterized protein LOC128549538 n=1 Tax=Mercenaria mercenaria TaxID=6596 RepID=UPI00234F9EA8|nr:uncharacterized protein LOC128549538 [Mercenaria mercenaria]
MDIYKLVRVVVLFCVINQGMLYNAKSSSREISDESSSNRSGSSRRGSGWWGGGRNRQSKPARSSRRGSGWWGGGRNRQSKPAHSGKRKSGWWGGKNRNVPTKSKGSGWLSAKPNSVPKTPPSSKPKSAPKSKQNTKPETDIKKVIERYEGIERKAYDAQPKNPKVHDTTIGIGFNLNRPDAEKTFKKVVPGVDFNKVKSGKQTITDKQARALFNHDVDNIYEPRARNKVGKDVYDKLPSNVKAAVVNAVYRGDLGPKATNLIKQGKWKEVGKEYLDHNQYKNADKLGIPGIKTRMDWNKKQFDTMIKQEKPK